MKKIISVTLLLCTVTSAQAFTLIASSLTEGWEGKELSFDVNESSCTALGISVEVLNKAIDNAVNLWNGVPTSRLKLKRGGTTTSTTTTGTNPPTIYCTTSVSSPNAVAGEGAVGATLLGRPINGYLRLNGDSARVPYFGNLKETQQQLVMAHEMGHVLGLGHSEKSYALMYYDLSTKTHAYLSQDDMDGLSWLNPRNELGDGMMGCGTLSDISKNIPPPPGGPGVIANWIALFGLVYWATRSRRRSI